jgi:hypothetical protein
MTEFAADDRRNELRASDQDREHTAEILREAAAVGRLDMDELDDRLNAVYTAKTYGELAPIVRDLPQTAGGPMAPATSAAPADPARFGGNPTSSSAVAVMSGFSRKGAWIVPRLFKSVAIMGGGEIDMRDARFATREVTIRVVAIMGGVGITVPEDADVRVSGFGLMGAFDQLSSVPEAPGGPVINITGFAFWGGVGVERKPPRGKAKSQLRQRKEEWKQELRQRKEELRRERRGEWKRELDS